MTQSPRSGSQSPHLAVLILLKAEELFADDVPRRYGL